MTFEGIKTISKAEALKAGMRPLTRAYHLPSESEMLSAVIRDMQRGAGITFALVALLTHLGKGIEVWRGGIIS
jgi:hypothetical protein